MPGDTQLPLVGRQGEQKILAQLLKSKKSEFLALYGRRRVGKTTLIKTFFEDSDCHFFYVTGIQEGDLSVQLAAFAKQLGETFYGGAPIAPSSSWLEAFEQLTRAIEQLPSKRKVVLFFDEFPWMATPRSQLLQALEYYWNRFWCHDTRLKLIICGSSASWIMSNIINNKGGLYNRVTRTMMLKPFSLGETRDFLRVLGVKLSEQQVLELYMILGGIPHYLAMVQKGLSAQQNIEALCFRRDGALVQEFDRLFASLFRDAEAYVVLIREIAKHRYGIGQAELARAVKSGAGGTFGERLKALTDAGFIQTFVPHGHSEKGIYYKVIDEFSLFYLRWVEPNLKTIARQDEGRGYWLAKTKSASWRSWAGYAFESVCFKHLAQIRRALNIDPGADVASWRYAPQKREAQGAQVDLLFDRSDGAITLCEIKYRGEAFVIDKAYSKILMNKMEVYRQRTRTKKEIFMAMITANGLKPSLYSEELICGDVVLGDLFDKV